jgi:hypothetical protein
MTHFGFFLIRHFDLRSGFRASQEACDSVLAGSLPNIPSLDFTKSGCCRIRRELEQ